jgi:hypothetical protein
MTRLVKAEKTMADCELLAVCALFAKIKDLPKTAAQLATTYCYGDNRGCARLWVASSGVRPPDDLFPNEQDRALRILSKSGKTPASVVHTTERTRPE